VLAGILLPAAKFWLFGIPRHTAMDTCTRGPARPRVSDSGWGMGATSWDLARICGIRKFPPSSSKGSIMKSVKEIVQQMLNDPRHQENIEYGKPRSGHPEGKVRYHIPGLEASLNSLAARGISEGDYWKLKFLIHVHDSFKKEAKPDAPILDPERHATLAGVYASQFTSDADFLNMNQFHDGLGSGNNSVERAATTRGGFRSCWRPSRIGIISSCSQLLMEIQRARIVPS